MAGDVARCVELELEREREEREGVGEQLAQVREQLQQETQKTATLEGNISELSQLNSDLQNQLK